MATLDNLEIWLADWILTLNEVSPVHQGPRCPYAKSVWDNKRAKIVKLPKANTNEFWTTIITECNNFNDNNDVIIVATESNPQILHYEQVNGGVDALNCSLNIQNKDIWLLPSCNNFYTMVFVQRITKIDDASKVLEQTTHYKQMHPLFFDKFITQRRKLREQLQKIDN
jgi:hypothetical protein